DLIQPMPPTGATVQRSDDASFKISEISSADAGETVTVPLLDEMYSSPTICDSDLSRKGAKESLRRKDGLNSSLRLCDSFAPLRETSTLASPQPRNIGTIFPGLQSPSGSNAARTLNIAFMSASENTSGNNSRLSSPTPCSPVIVPPAPTQTSISSRPASFTLNTWSAKRESKQMSGCKLPSPA